MKSLTSLAHNTRILFTILGSLVTAVGVGIPSFWILTPVGLGMYLYDLWKHTSTIAGSAVRGSIYGMVTAAAGIIWFWQTLPVPWLVQHPSVQYAAVAVIWLLIAFMMGLGTTLSAPALWVLRKLPHRVLFVPPIAAALWTFQEYLRMLFYGFITLGGESLQGAHFSVAALGYSFAESPYLLSIATFGGVYALSGAVALVAAVGTFVVIEQKKPTRLLPLVLWLSALLLLPTLPKHISELPSPLTVGVVTLSEHDENAGFDSLSDNILSTAPPLLVFPETVSPQWLFDAHDQRINDTLVIFSRYRVVPGSQGSAELEYKTGGGDVLATYHKQLLMPLGEYIPSFTKIAFGIIPSPALHTRVQKTDGVLTRGREEPQPVLWHGVALGALLCSENLSPRLYSTLAHKGSSVLINLANVTWFHNSDRVMHLLVTLGKVHAVSHGTYFILAAKGGYSFVLNPHGEMVARSTPNRDSLMVVTLP